MEADREATRSKLTLKKCQSTIKNSLGMLRRGDTGRKSAHDEKSWTISPSATYWLVSWKTKHWVNWGAFSLFYQIRLSNLRSAAYFSTDFRVNQLRQIFTAGTEEINPTIPEPPSREGGVTGGQKGWMGPAGMLRAARPRHTDRKTRPLYTHTVRGRERV